GGGPASRPGRAFDGRGRRMAFVLGGAWRPPPPPLEISRETLDDIALGLLRSKTGALAWWRVRSSSLRASAAGERLREAYHHHGFQTALHARNLTRIVTRLRAGGVDPLLVKGPAIGRLYPERGLRPFGDLDLCVRPDQYHTASAVLDDWVGEFSPVDLHRGLSRLYAQSWDDVYARTHLETFGGSEVRV